MFVANVDLSRYSVEEYLEIRDKLYGEAFICKEIPGSCRGLQVTWDQSRPLADYAGIDPECIHLVAGSM